MIKLSTGLKTAMLGDIGMSALMDRGVIELYTGSQPVSADYPPTGLYLGRVTEGGNSFVEGDPTNGLSLNRAIPGELYDNGDWKIRFVASGTVGWFRWRWWAVDDESLSGYYPRLDGIINNGLFLRGRTATAGQVVSIDRFNLKFRSQV